MLRRRQSKSKAEDMYGNVPLVTTRDNRGLGLRHALCEIEANQSISTSPK
jgi:hypothetical protein